MHINIKVFNLTDNDADYFARTLFSMGANVSIDFDNHLVNAKQEGPLEKLLETASVAFHTNDYSVEILGGDYYGEEES